MIKEPTKLIKLGEDTCGKSTWDEVCEQRVYRDPPVSPKYFSELIDHKHITSGKDKDLLKEKSKCRVA